MFYIERNSAGKIIGIHSSPTKDAKEPKTDLDPEIMDFLNATGMSHQLGPIMSEFDQNIIRVLDDLIDVLVKKNIIMFTDLPTEAQEKIKWRKILRQKISSPNFMVDDIL